MLRAVLVATVLVSTLLIPTVGVIADDTPKIELKPYGYLKLDGSYDQNQTSHGNFAMWVNNKSFDENDNQFNMTANQTRLGVNAKGTGYETVGIGGNVEFDLYGGVTGATVAENKAMLQLRHAYFTLAKGNTRLLVGQSWDLISPLNPATVNYAVLWSCGNMGYRRPQITLFQSVPTSANGKVTLAAGVFRTIGSNLTPTFTLATGETADGADDGTDAAIPSVQGRLDIEHKFSNGTALWIGGSGLWGRLKASTSLGHYEHYDSWVGSGHLQITFPAGFGLNGEYYTGSNTGSYFGGIANGNSIDGVRASGGWASAWAKLGAKLKVTGGFGVDQVESDDISAGSRTENQCIFGNLNYTIVPQVSVGLEVSNWETAYKDGDTVSCLRTQTGFVLNF